MPKLKKKSFIRLTNRELSEGKVFFEIKCYAEKHRVLWLLWWNRFCRTTRREVRKVWTKRLFNIEISRHLTSILCSSDEQLRTTMQSKPMGSNRLNENCWWNSNAEKRLSIKRLILRENAISHWKPNEIQLKRKHCSPDESQSWETDTTAEPSDWTPDPFRHLLTNIRGRE